MNWLNNPAYENEIAIKEYLEKYKDVTELPIKIQNMGLLHFPNKKIKDLKMYDSQLILNNLYYSDMCELLTDFI